nr:PREDICTED: uncharacterized protein LOC109034388 isoform X2 [Bemisia tabaci]
MLLQHKGTGPNHVSCLITALYNGEVETVETLLQHGWDVNGQIPSQGRSPYTPIHVPYWHPRLSEPPSYRYPFENKEVPTENDVIGYNKLSGGRPLHMAIVRRFGTAVSLLLDYGADVNAPTDRGFTPLQQAVRAFFPKQGTYFYFHPRPNETWKASNIIPALLSAGAHAISEDFRQNFHLGFFLRDESPFVLRSFLAHKFPDVVPPSDEVALQSLLHDAGTGRVCQYTDTENTYPLRWWRITRDEITLAHTTWLEAAGTLILGGRPVPERSDLIGQSSKLIVEFADKCRNEVERLKATLLPIEDEIDPGGYSVYVLLTCGDSLVARLARNAILTRFVTSEAFEKDFPIYGGCVRMRLRKRYIRGEHVDEILRVYRAKPNRLMGIPAEALERVLRHLSTQELRLVVRAFAPSKS